MLVFTYIMAIDKFSNQRLTEFNKYQKFFSDSCSCFENVTRTEEMIIYYCLSFTNIECFNHFNVSRPNINCVIEKSQVTKEKWIGQQFSNCIGGQTSTGRHVGKSEKKLVKGSPNLFEMK